MFRLPFHPGCFSECSKPRKFTNKSDKIYFYFIDHFFFEYDYPDVDSAEFLRTFFDGKFFAK